MDAARATQIAMLLFSTAVLLLLLAVLTRLIARRRQRAQAAPLAPANPPSRPFPQSLPTGWPTPRGKRVEQLHVVVREAFSGWQQRLILPDEEAGRAFLRVGVERYRLRYQLSATSLGQGLAMLLTVLMAGPGQEAQVQFENLLAFCLAHPGSDSPELTSWQVLPDTFPARALPADPHGEAWVALSLLMAQMQWGQGVRFDYPSLARARLEALLALPQATSAGGQESSQVAMPLFWRIFSQATGEQAWMERSEAATLNGGALLAGLGEGLDGDGSAAEARQGLQLLQLGLALLWGEMGADESLKASLRQSLGSAIAPLVEKLEAGEADEVGGFSVRALLACTVPSAIALGDAPALDALWDALARLPARRPDGMGESLGLLGLLLMGGQVWLAEVDWSTVLEQKAAREGGTD